MREKKDIIIEHQRGNSIQLVQKLLETGTVFNLYIKNNNDWKKPLPKTLTDKYILIEFSGDTLNDSYIKNGKIIIKTRFDNKKNKKKLTVDEIIAILDADRLAYMVIDNSVVN